MAASGTTNPRSWRKLRVSLGLVSFEVGISPLMGEGKVEGHRYCPDHQCRTNQQVTCQSDGHIVADPISGYPVGESFVQVDPEEVAMLLPEKDSVIKLTGFDDERNIDPLYFEKSYNIWPSDKHHGVGFDAVAYTLRDKAKVAIGTCCLTKTTRMVVLSWSDELRCLVLHVCNFAANIRTSDVEKVVGGYEARTAPAPEILSMADALIEQLPVSFDEVVRDFEDSYATALTQVIARKATGEHITVDLTEKEVPVAPDLMEQMRAMVAETATKKKPAKKKAA